MSLRDTQQGYSWLSIALHWITAIAVITLYLLAELSEDMPKAERREMMTLHVSIAMSLYIILWARIFWRLGNTRPALPRQNILLDQLARWVPMVLLAGIAIMLVSGPFLIWSNGSPIEIFNTISLPSPMEKNHDLHELGEEIHKFGGKVILVGVLLHVLGAIKHLAINRDDVMKKMLKPDNN